MLFGLQYEQSNTPSNQPVLHVGENEEMMTIEEAVAEIEELFSLATSIIGREKRERQRQAIDEIKRIVGVVTTLEDLPISNKPNEDMKHD
tara:strand:- start:4161 stop:4430 length:270 start_codon:yes stop_codon:yes gene_type:complete